MKFQKVLNVFSTYYNLLKLNSLGVVVGGFVGMWYFVSTDLLKWCLEKD